MVLGEAGPYWLVVRSVVVLKGRWLYTQQHSELEPCATVRLGSAFSVKPQCKGEVVRKQVWEAVGLAAELRQLCPCFIQLAVGFDNGCLAFMRRSYI